MPEPLAWTIYLIGFVAVLTSPLDVHKGRWPVVEGLMTLVVALLWPLAAMVIIVGRIVRTLRHG